MEQYGKNIKLNLKKQYGKTLWTQNSIGGIQKAQLFRLRSSLIFTTPRQPEALRFWHSGPATDPATTDAGFSLGQKPVKTGRTTDIPQNVDRKTRVMNSLRKVEHFLPTGTWFLIVWIQHVG
jgi:hypothetical protein